MSDFCFVRIPETTTYNLLTPYGRSHGQLFMDDSGFYCAWLESKGNWSCEDLRAIADKLQELNADWVWKVTVMHNAPVD